MGDRDEARIREILKRLFADRLHRLSPRGSPRGLGDNREAGPGSSALATCSHDSGILTRLLSREKLVLSTPLI